MRPSLNGFMVELLLQVLTGAIGVFFCPSLWQPDFAAFRPDLPCDGPSASASSDGSSTLYAVLPVSSADESLSRAVGLDSV